MSAPQFTPGPWLVHDTIDGPLSNTDVRDSRNLWVARCAAMAGRPHVTETEANARLIAAAPELYEALDYLINQRNLSLGSLARKKIAAALAEARGEHD